MKNKEDCQFIGELGQYKIQATEDGSITLWSEKFDENCHSTAGAWQETLYNYFLGCEIPKKIQSLGEIRVLDVGFGLGLGLKVLRTELAKIPSDQRPKLHYTSLELDPRLVEWSFEHSFDTKLAPQKIQQDFYLEDSLGMVQIFVGDARLRVPQMRAQGQIKNLHAIFQDPFSPKKNPTLWTKEWFEELAKCSHPEVILSTYSASNRVRKALFAAGWSVFARAGFGPKRSCTGANLSGVLTSDESLKKMLLSPKVLPLTDFDCDNLSI